MCVCMNGAVMWKDKKKKKRAKPLKAKGYENPSKMMKEKLRE